MKKQFLSRWGRLIVCIVILGILVPVLGGCGGGGGGEANGGAADNPGEDWSIVTYNAPASYVDAQLTVSVSDGRGGVAYGAYTLPVVCCGYAKLNPAWPGEAAPAVTATSTGENHLPVIVAVVTEYTQIERGKSGGVRCVAYDPDGDKLTYTWDADRGTITK